MLKNNPFPVFPRTLLAYASLLFPCLLGLTACDLFNGAKDGSRCGCTSTDPFPGQWSTQSTSDLVRAEYRMLDFQDGGGYTNTVMYSDGSPDHDFYQEKGSWRTHADTLFLEYRAEWKDRSGRDLGPVSKTTTRTVQRFRVNDSGLLATIPASQSNQILIGGIYGNAWQYYRPGDGKRYPRSLPRGEFAAHAFSDTFFAVLDTIPLRAWPGDAAKSPAKYLWSYDGGRTYPDTSSAGATQRVWGINQTGLHVVAVKGVDPGGQASEPYYFEAMVHAYAPALQARDQDVYCFSDGRLTVDAHDTNGTVEKYFFGSTTVSTALDSGTAPIFQGGCLEQDAGFSIKVRDDDGLYSPVISIKVRNLPAKTIGTHTVEFGRYLFRESGGYIVFGGSGETSIGGGHYLMAQSLDAAANTIAKKIFMVNPSGYALDQTTLGAVAEFPSGGYLLAGGIDDTYGVVDSAYAIRLDAEHKPVWSKTFRDSGSVGSGFIASAETDGGFILGGWSFFAPGGEICRLCPSYASKLKLTRIDAAGGTLWNRLYPHSGDWYRMRMAADASGRVFVLTDSLLVAVDKQGVEQWSRPLGFAGVDMAILRGGKIILAGTRGAASLLMEIDADGNPIREIPQESANPVRIIPLDDGGALLLGYEGKIPDPDSSNPNENDSTEASSVTRLDANLGRVWRTGFIHFTLADAQMGIDDGFTLLGNTTRFGNGSADPVIIALDKDGHRIW